MKFKDIKRLTSIGTYQVNQRLKYLLKWIEEQDDIDLNPDFQRGYVWTEEQQIKYIEFILKGGNTTPIYFNHSNWLSFTNPVDKLEIVDGKQRMNACIRFLNNEIKAFNTYYKDFEDNCYTDIMININNLKTRKEVLNWYLELNSGGTAHTKEELDKVKLLIEKENLKWDNSKDLNKN